MHGSRRALTAAAALLLLGPLTPAVAQAPGMSLAVSGASIVHPGSRLLATVHADTLVGVRLGVFRAQGRCAARLEDELGHRQSAWVLQRFVVGAFSARIDLPPAHPGTHHVCAYLYHRHLDNLITDDRADFTYVAR